MRITRGLLGFGVGSLVLTLLVVVPGCGSGASAGLGPMLQDAPLAQAGQITTASYQKSRPKKAIGTARQAPIRRADRRSTPIAS